jgi:hypothetical protein
VTPTQIKPRIRQTAAALGQVSHIWLNPKHPLRREAVAALSVSTGYMPRVIDTAIDAAFKALMEEKILEFCAAEAGLSDALFVPRNVLHILAGNVFTAWLPGAVITLLLGADCALKPSSHEPVFAPLWKRSVQQVDPELAKKIWVVRWTAGLAAAFDAVVAYGSDETLARIRENVPTAARFVGYGHKFSVGVIWKEALAPERRLELVDQLRQDIEPFDLRGCLSPQVLYVEGKDPGILANLGPEVRALPQVRSFQSWDSLKEELRRHRDQLSCLGVSEPAARFADIYADMEPLGISRACPLGEMQRPPLTWRNGGFSLVEALCRR